MGQLALMTGPHSAVYSASAKTKMEGMLGNVTLGGRRRHASLTIITASSLWTDH
jgi:hypothetical protein